MFVGSCSIDIIGYSHPMHFPRNRKTSRLLTLSEGRLKYVHRGDLDYVAPAVLGSARMSYARYDQLSPIPISLSWISDLLSTFRRSISRSRSATRGSVIMLDASQRSVPNADENGRQSRPPSISSLANLSRVPSRVENDPKGVRLSIAKHKDSIKAHYDVSSCTYKRSGSGTRRSERLKKGRHSKLASHIITFA